MTIAHARSQLPSRPLSTTAPTGTQFPPPEGQPHLVETAEGGFASAGLVDTHASELPCGSRPSAPARGQVSTSLPLGPRKMRKSKLAPPDGGAVLFLR